MSQFTKAAERYQRDCAEHRALEAHTFGRARTWAEPPARDFLVVKDAGYRVVEIRDGYYVRDWFEGPDYADAAKIADLLRKAKGLKRVTVQ